MHEVTITNARKSNSTAPQAQRLRLLIDQAAPGDYLMPHYLRVSCSLSVFFKMPHMIIATAVARQTLLMAVLGLTVAPKRGIAITT